MNERKDVDISKYLKDGVLYLENLHLVDCRIAGLQSEWAKDSLVMKKCSFENVVFESHCGRGFVEIEECEFMNCTFHDTLKNGKLNVEQNRFENCMFESVCIHRLNESSEISQCRFSDCNFNNIDLKWQVSLYELELNGGRIEHFCIAGQHYITRIRIFNMGIEVLSCYA